MEYIFHVLMLEDNPGDAKLNAEQLEDSGLKFTYHRVEKEQDYLKELEEFKPDIVLADYKLPQFDCITALHVAHERYPLIPFIIVSGEVGEGVAISLLKEGASDYIFKRNIARLGSAVINAIEVKTTREDKARAEEELRKSYQELAQMNKELQLEIITRRLAEDKLRKTGGTLEKIFSTTHICIVYLDKEFNFLRVNRAFAKECGHDEDFFVDKNYFSLYPDAKNENIFLRTVETGEAISVFAWPFEYIEYPEHKRTYWDWTISPVKDFNGSVKELIFILVNVTDRILSQERIQESEARLSKAQQIAHLGYWEWNVSTNALFWSEEVYTIFGYDPDVFIPTYETFLNCIHPEDREKVTKAVDEAIHNYIPYNMDHRVITPDGDVRFVNEQGEVHIDAEGQAIRMIGTVLDITPLKISEQKRMEAIQLAERTSRLASIGAVAGGITHEINQPLNAIKVSVDGILYWYKNNKGLVPEQFISMLEKISASVERINDIIKHMRTFWVTQDHKVREDFNMNDMVIRALSLIKQQLSSHGIKTVAEICQQAPFINGNPIHIEQIVINLVTNAMHSLDDVSRKDKTILVKTLTENDSVKLMVIDNGTGIPPGIDDRLFDPFYSSRKPGEGTGLGLSIVKQFVDEHKGSIKFENIPSGGVIFTIRFPLSQNLMINNKV